MMRQYAEYTHDRDIRKQRLDRAEAHQRNAAALGKKSSKQSAQTAPSGDKPKQVEPAGEDDYEEEILGMITTSTVKWEDVGGL